MARHRLRLSVRQFLEGSEAAYKRFIVAMIQDGVAEFEDEFGVQSGLTPADFDRITGRLVGFYLPSLVKLYRELLALVGYGADAETWIKQNGWRIEQAIAGITWSAAEAGYALAASQTQPDGTRYALYWELDESVEQHCALCPVFADGSPYRDFFDLPGWPGDGSTPCGARCYCTVVAEPV